MFSKTQVCRFLRKKINYFDPCDLKIRPNDLKTGQNTYPDRVLEK